MSFAERHAERRAREAADAAYKMTAWSSLHQTQWGRWHVSGTFYGDGAKQKAQECAGRWERRAKTVRVVQGHGC